MRRLRRAAAVATTSMGHFDLAGSSRDTQSAAVPLHKLGAKTHGQPEHRDEHRLLNMDWLGPEEALDGAVDHERSDHQQEDRAGSAAQHLELPGAELEPRILRALADSGIGKGAQSNGHRMASHVEAACQQRHRVVEPAHGDLDHHHRGRDPHRQARAAVVGNVAGVEDS
jgi:hypothetical protein